MVIDLERLIRFKRRGKVFFREGAQGDMFHFSDEKEIRVVLMSPVNSPVNKKLLDNSRKKDVELCANLFR